MKEQSTGNRTRRITRLGYNIFHECATLGHTQLDLNYRAVTESYREARYKAEAWVKEIQLTKPQSKDKATLRERARQKMLEGEPRSV